MIFDTLSVQSVWRLDPSATNPSWVYVTGSNVTRGSTDGQPSARKWHACDAAPSSGGYCFGGWIDGKYLYTESLFLMICVLMKFR
jgi:hypothetical protein